MARPSWSGFLRFNLISVPVNGYSSTKSGGGKIGFHQLHSTCHSRIHYKKVCPIHGEVAKDEIVSGYEVSKGKYVTVEAEERSALKAEDEKTIAVSTFVRGDEIDPVYFSGRSYYLVPDGKIGQKPYAVLLAAMRDEKRCAIAQVVFSGRMQIAVVQPSGDVLAMSLLKFQSELKQSGDFADEVDTKDVTAEERKLAETLIEAATSESFDLGQYKDEHSTKLARLIEGKTPHKVKETRRKEDGNEPAVINLMDALRRSLAQTKKDHGSKPATKRKAQPHSRRRKTG